MSLIKQPFINYKTEEEKERDKDKGEAITLWLNKEERLWLNNNKVILNQGKDGTAIKQLAFIGSKLVGDQKTAYVLEVVLENKRKNQRTGNIEIE